MHTWVSHLPPLLFCIYFCLLFSRASVRAGSWGKVELVFHIGLRVCVRVMRQQQTAWTREWEEEKRRRRRRIYFETFLKAGHDGKYVYSKGSMQPFNWINETSAGLNTGTSSNRTYRTIVTSHIRIIDWYPVRKTQQFNYLLLFILHAFQSATYIILIMRQCNIRMRTYKQFSYLNLVILQNYYIRALS